LEVIITIIPIFAIILLGWGARKKGFITPEFLEPANRLVYYLSIPAMVFISIARSSFHEQFDIRVLSLTLLAATGIYSAAFIFTRFTGMNPDRAGSFVQCSGHGNVGYVGLPIAFYYLGDAGLAKAAIISGFMMLLHNLLSVATLQLHDTTGKGLLGFRPMMMKLMGNPVIIGAMTGIAASALEIPIPRVIIRSLDILGGMAPPMALLLIGASLSMKLMLTYLRPTLGVLIFKLILLPAAGLLFFNLFSLRPDDYLPALILLCSPTATVAYIMAREMHGDADFTAAAISASTLFSSITFMLCLAAVSHLGG
jgi:predicted permease